MAQGNGAITDHTATTPEPVDVLICGSGSAGLACALWLTTYNSRFCSTSTSDSGLAEDRSARPAPSNTPRPITYRILESRKGPLELGQADGVQCRTVEIYESLGLEHHLLKEGYWVNEVCFWAADENDNATPSDGTSAENQNTAGKVKTDKRRKIIRTGRTADVQPGLSHQPHVILNQARINNLMLERIHDISKKTVDYGWKVLHVEAGQAEETFPVKVTAEKDGKEVTYRARYVLGSDGAHSQVRRSLKIPMEGDSTNAVWGVMDVYPGTNFPDIRKKTTIRSDVGTLMIIPREGDSLVRTYFELPSGTNPKQVKLEDLQRIAKDMFYPYEIDFLDTAWWSAYSIGQRLAKTIVDDSGHIFLAGDACHTHSPKAGQGMNCSLQDGYNLGWKLGALLSGQANENILHSYIQERQKYAHQLIEFDRYFAKLFTSGGKDGQKPSSEEFNQAFIKAGVFTAGMAANYNGSDLTNVAHSKQELANKVIVGQRLPSAQLVRMSDSKALQLLRLLQSDGRWRVIIFGGDIDNVSTLTRLNKVSRNQKSCNDDANKSRLENISHRMTVF